MSLITLRFPGRCFRCSRTLSAGARAEYDRATRTVSCSDACQPVAQPGADRSVVARAAVASAAVASTATPAEAEAALKALLVRLDPDQRQVAGWTPADGNLRVLAGAGSGKTTTVVGLVASLIKAGYAAASIVVTTFTNKAAGELAERLAKVLPAEQFAPLRVGTFHSLALRSLRAVDGRFSDFGLCLDSNKRKAGIPGTRLLWSMVLGWGEIKGTNLQGLDLDLPDGAVRDYAQAADLIRAHGDEPGTLEARTAALKIERDEHLRCFSQAWDHFAEAKRQLGTWDFADTLAAYRTGLQTGTIRDAATVVIVDEAQDNSRVQLDIAHKLARAGRLILVGDARQAIYEWRGAYPKLFAEAGKLIGAQTRGIRYNYRSGQKIVALANRIAHGQSWGLGGDQIAARAETGEVRRRQYADPGDEADTIADEIRAALDEKSETADGYAILARTNAQLGPIEAALIKAKVPCVVVGGTPFFARRETKDFLAYCVLAVRDDADALERIANRPKRLLGKAFVASVRTAYVGGRSLADAIEAVIPTLRSRQAAGARDLLAALARLRASRGFAPEPVRADDAPASPPHAADVAAAILAPPKPADERHGGQGGDEDNGSGLVSSAAGIAHGFDSVDVLLRFAGQCESGVVSIGEDEDIPQGRVTVSTIHRSKGREFRRVHVLATAGLFPHRRSEGDPAREAEEKRLFYVACTRAKDSLTLSHCLEGLYGTGGESPFVTEWASEPDPEDGGSGGRPAEVATSDRIAVGPGRPGQEFALDDSTIIRTTLHDIILPPDHVRCARCTDPVSAADLVRHDDEALCSDCAAELGYPAAVTESVPAPAAPSGQPPATTPAPATEGREVCCCAPPPVPVVVRLPAVADALARVRAAIPAAVALPATPEPGGRWCRVTRQDFDALLSPLGFEATEANGQVVFDLDLGWNLACRVYSSLPVDSNEARGRGEDSIRVVLLRRHGTDTRPLMRKQAYRTRTRGWRAGLLARIEAALLSLGPACRKCGAPTVQRVGKDGRSWWACSQYPNCTGGAGDCAPRKES